MTIEAALNQWLHDYPGIFRFLAIDGPATSKGLMLEEVTSGKRLGLTYGQIKQWRRHANAEGLIDYLNIVFEDNREVILCHSGFAFAPISVDPEIIGNDLPPVVCLQDYGRIQQHLEHLHQHPESRLESIKTLMILLSILEGARQIGFDIGEEERSAEHYLEALEKI